MILSKKLSEAFNAQVNAEMWSSNLYLSMSVHFQKLGLNGFAHWMKKQAEEEMGHAHKMIDFTIDRGGDITIGQINVVPTAWGSVTELFEHVYKHECYVSELIDKWSISQKKIKTMHQETSSLGSFASRLKKNLQLKKS